MSARRHPPTPPPGARVFVSRFEARSYELDSFGHVNHAVYFNYFEAARFAALAEGGFPVERFRERNWGIYLVHAEADFIEEATLGTVIEVSTWVAAFRRTSLVIEHTAHATGDPARVIATGRIVSVCVGPDGRPMRFPDEARRALGAPDADA